MVLFRSAINRDTILFCVRVQYVARAEPRGKSGGKTVVSYVYSHVVGLQVMCQGGGVYRTRFFVVVRLGLQVSFQCTFRGEKHAADNCLAVATCERWRALFVWFVSWRVFSYWSAGLTARASHKSPPFRQYASGHGNAAAAEGESHTITPTGSERAEAACAPSAVTRYR